MQDQNALSANIGAAKAGFPKVGENRCFQREMGK